MMRTVGGTAYQNSPTRLRSQPVTRSRFLPSWELQGPPVSPPLSTSCFPGDIPLLFSEGASGPSLQHLPNGEDKPTSF